MNLLYATPANEQESFWSYQNRLSICNGHTLIDCRRRSGNIYRSKFLCDSITSLDAAVDYGWKRVKPMSSIAGINARSAESCNQGN